MEQRTLGNYTLTHRLGVGGMGEVWKGRREAIGGAAVDVAIKVLSPQRASDPEARRMFFDEARLSLLLNNSNIVKVFDVAETSDGTCYMVMEWVDGLNLTQLSSKMRKHGERIPDALIAYIIGEVLKGLAHAHELRSPETGESLTIVHRDVSPHNVMVSVHGEVKIMDFGVARIASEDTSGVHVKGKLRYMPPEQLQGETREPTLDLFSVGAILHELLDGVKFRNLKVDEGRMFGMIFAGEVPPMEREPATIPAELELLRANLLRPRAAERIQSAREAFRALSRWSGYRDARFDLDELVRRYVNESDHVRTVVEAPPSPPQPEDDATSIYDSGQSPRGQPGFGEAPIAAGGPGVHPSGSSSHPALGAGHESAQGSFTGAPAPAPEGPMTADGTVVMLPSEGSSTDVSRRLGSTTGQVPRPSDEAANDGGSKKALLIGVGLAFLCFVGLGVAAAAGAFGDDEPKTAARDEAEPTPKAEPTPEPVVEDEPVLEDEPIVEDEPVLEDEPIVEDEPEDEDEPEPKSNRSSAAKVKVAIRLGGGLPWAEFKLGNRTFELDAFARKTGSTRVSPGSYRVSYRTTIDGAWKQAGRVTIPDSNATITLSKGGQISVN